jgi:hypothetical protein
MMILLFSSSSVLPQSLLFVSLLGLLRSSRWNAAAAAASVVVGGDSSSSRLISTVIQIRRGGGGDMWLLPSTKRTRTKLVDNFPTGT